MSYPLHYQLLPIRPSVIPSALAQASMSSTSLALSQVPSPQTSLRDKLALPRFRSRTPSNTTSRGDSGDGRRPSLPTQSPYSSPSPNFRALSPTNGEYYSNTDSRPSYAEPPSPHTPSHPQDFHPYANPDLVRAFSRDTSPSRRLEELHALAHSAPHSPSVIPHSDSTATITESSTSTTISTASNFRSETVSSIASGTSLSSVASQNGFSPTSRAFAKGISAPIPLEGNQSPMRSSNETGVSSAPGGKWDPPFTPTGFAGWQENTSAPIKLISLEEAQAQARERSRSATVNGTPISAPVDPGTSRQAQSAPGSGGRSRTRTTSAGAKAKKLTSASAVDLHAQVDGFGDGPHTAPPLKTVSRKRSGFMRLFNAREKAQSPPPVPSLSMEAISSPPPSIPVRTRKQSTHRVPVPSLTPSLMADIEGKPSFSSLESRSISEGMIPPMPAVHHHPTPPPHAVRQLSLRRNAPGLSIMPPSPPETTVRVVDGSLTPTSGVADPPPFSASPDPRSPEFVALSLRPVSTTFSADFAGQLNHAVQNGSRHSSDTDASTPTSSTAISPQSPGFPLSTDKRGDKAEMAAQEDQSAVIQALQEQILAARRGWQREVWELEGQVRDLKLEVEELRAANSAREYCPACGRGSIGRPGDDDPHLDDLRRADVKITSVVNRPRARTGVGSRFASRT